MNFEKDDTGHLWLQFETLGLWVQWLPATKIQFEHFLCATGDARFDARWYSDLLELNPRAAPHDLGATNYWRALVSGLLPQEAESFARWMGRGCRLPTDEEWSAIYEYAKDAKLPERPPEEILASLPERNRRLVERLAELAAARRAGDGQATLADRMLLRGGVMEWVREGRPEVGTGGGFGGAARWSGRGEPPRQFHAALYMADDPEPSRPNDPETRRLPQCGFRLVRSAAS